LDIIADERGSGLFTDEQNLEKKARKGSCRKPINCWIIIVNIELPYLADFLYNEK